ncbi:antitoxin [Sphingomonas sp.]
MKHECAIFEQPDPRAEAASVARARADIAAGRVAGDTIDWLKSWGTPDENPAPREWFR